MPTVSKSIADEAIAGNGIFPGDEHLPPIVKIVKYQNMFNGADTYGLVYEGTNPNAYAPSQSVINPTIYWEFKEEGD